MRETLTLTSIPIGFVIGGRYEIVGTVGEGGMGVVFRVQDRQDGQTKALKILKDASDKHVASERRFRREYRALARLRHPAVVDVYDTGLHDGHLFFVMEYVQGHTLADWGTLTPIGNRTEDELHQELDFYLQTMVTVLDALSDVHQSGVVHRDLKPQNIMVDHEGAVRIMDFGVALELRAPASETSSNTILGTVGYVSPEEVRGVKLDARADLYSVGAMLYEYATGIIPFDDENPILAFSRMLKEDPIPVRKLQPFISRELEQVIHKLMARDPDDRFQSAEEAAVTLNLCLESGDARANSESSTVGVRLPLPALYSSRFIGQQVAMHLLGRLLEKSQRGHGRMALVLGEAGIGKTRLLQELAISVERSQLLFLRGSCFEREGHFYQPFVEMIGDYVRRVGKTSKRDRLMDRLYDADLFPLMRELAREPEEGAEGKDLPAVGPGASPETKVRLSEAVARLLGDFARQRSILIHLDDMHFADELTLELTRYLARNLKGSPVLLVVSVRPEELESTEATQVRRFLDDMRREGLMDAEVKLARLNRDEVGELIGSLVRWDPPASLVDEVFRLTDGIPYFVEEVTKSLPLTGPGGSPRSAEEIPIPATVAEIVQRQLMDLRTDAREVLRMAAHIGTDFDFDLLLEVSGRKESDLLDLIDEFLSQGVISEISTPRRDAYRFTHPAVREMLLRQVGERRRRKTHQRIAEAMEDLYHDRLEAELSQNIEEIARQYRLSGDAEKAFEYGWIAGKKALERRAFDAGLRHFLALVQLADAGKIEPSAAQRSELVLDLGTCYERTGRLPEARELYTREKSRLRTEGEASERCEVGRRLARICTEEGRIEDALVEMERVVDQSAELDAGTRVQMETELARLLEAKGEHDQALSVLLTTLQLAEEQRATGPMADAMGLLGSIFTTRGEYLEAARYLEKALEIARSTSEGAAAPTSRRVASILSLLAENSHQALDSALEIRFYAECVKELDSARDLMGAVAPLARMGRAYVVLGELDRAGEILGDAVKRCRRYALTRSLPVALEAQSLHSVYRGRLRAARAELLEAFDQAESVGDVPVFFQVALSLGELLTLLRAFNEAAAYLEQAKELAWAKDNPLWKIQVLSAQAELCLENDQLAETHARLAEVESLESVFRALITPKHFVPSYVVRGRLSSREEDVVRAQDSFERALSSLSDVVWPYMLGACHVRYAQFLRSIGDRDRAREELEKSKLLWNWLGTTHFLRICEEETERLK